MNTPLTDQIRDYFGDADREQGAVDLAAVLRGVEEGGVVLVDVSRVDPPPVRRRSWWVGGLAAAATVAVVVAGLVVTRNGDEAPDAADTTLTPSDPSFTAEDALAVADEYFERYNAGDVAGVLGLFAAEATYSSRWCCDSAEYTPELFEMLLEWDVAQGTQLIERVCSDSAQPAAPDTEPVSADTEVAVVCEYGNDNAVTQAGRLDPVPIRLTLVIGSDGIDEWSEFIGTPDYVACCEVFGGWVGRNHPDEAVAIEFGAWTTVDEARAGGELRARRAAEWAATLEPSAEADPTVDESESAEAPGVTTIELSSLDGVVVEAPTDLVTSEVSPSSIGDLQWTAISVDPALLAAGGIVPTPAGFAVVRSDGQLLLSDDAIEWRSVVSPFPGRLNEVRVSGQIPLGPQHPQAAEFLMDTTEGLWVSSDFVTWNLSGTSSRASAPHGLAEWITGPEFLETTFVSDVETPDGAQLVHADWSIDWDTLVLQVGDETLRQRLADGAVLGGNSWDAETGIVTPALYASYEDFDTAMTLGDHNQAYERPPSGVQIRLSISGTVDDWVILLEDVTHGETLGSITGSLPALGPEDPAGRLSRVTLDDTLELLARSGGRLGAAFLLSGDRLELVQPPPWVSLPGSAPKFVVTDDEVYAYYDSGAWRSADGRTWQALDGDEFPTIHQFFTGPGGVVVAAADPTAAELQGGSVLLRSEDGINWAPPSQPPVLPSDQIWFSHLAAAESGFLYLAYETEFAVWTSTDGDIWERVDAPIPVDLGPDPRFGPGLAMGVTSSGTVVVLAGERYDGRAAPTTAWIIERVASR